MHRVDIWSAYLFLRSHFAILKIDIPLWLTETYTALENDPGFFLPVHLIILFQLAREPLSCMTTLPSFLLFQKFC